MEKDRKREQDTDRSTAASTPGAGPERHPGKPGGRNRGSARYAVLVFSICLAGYLLLYLLDANSTGMRTMTSGDEPHFLVMTTSLLEDHDLSLHNNYETTSGERLGYYDEVALEPYLVIGRNGRVVSSHSVLMSMLLLPGYAALDYRGAGITVILITSATAMFCFLITGMFISRKVALGVTLFFFFTYPLTAYSHRLYPEVPAMFLLVLGTWACLRVRGGAGTGYVVLAGISAGLLPLFHPKFLVLEASLILLFLLCTRGNRKRLAVFFAPLIVLFFALVLMTWYMYGPNIIKGLAITGGGGEFLEKLTVWGVFGLYLDRVWGLIPYAPLYLVLFMGIPLPARRRFRRWWVYLPVTVLAYTVVVGVFHQWDGGCSPVPRYLVPLLPLFILCAAVAMYGARVLAVKVGVLALAAVQLLLTVFTMIFPEGTYGIAGTWNPIYRHFLGANRLNAALQHVFPLFHPVTAWSCAVLVLWVVAIAALVFTRRYYLEPSPENNLGSGYPARGFTGPVGKPVRAR